MFIRSIFLLLFATGSLALTAQSASTQADVLADASAPTVQFRHMPTLPGGAVAFKNFLTQELAYPEAAREYAVEGTVVVRVLVAADGTSTVKGVEKSLFPACDEAALAAAAKLPVFLPAVAEGAPVSRELRIPFSFRLR